MICFFFYKYLLQILYGKEKYKLDIVVWFFQVVIKNDERKVYLLVGEEVFFKGKYMCLIIIYFLVYGNGEGGGLSIVFFIIYIDRYIYNGDKIYYI